jgi:hypothetical protein
MPLYKNVASQKLAVFAWDTANDAPKTGDAANITAQISKDGGATAATNDTNPSELDATDAPGMYLFDLTQNETNADLVIVCAVSGTSAIVLEPVIVYTTPGSSSGVHSVPQSLATQAKADVNAEVLDVLTVDTFAEPGQGTPAATTTILARLQYVYKAWRNKKDNDGTTTKLYNDDAATVDQQQTVSAAAGVVTKGEWTTGP